MTPDCNLDVSCLCPKCVEARAVQKSDKERIAELEWFVAQINQYVMPGEADTRDAALIAFKKQAERVDSFREDAEAAQRGLNAMGRENTRLREVLEQIATAKGFDGFYGQVLGGKLMDLARTALTRQDTQDGPLIDESANGAPSSVSTSVGMVKGSPISGPREGSNPSGPPTTVQVCNLCGGAHPLDVSSKNASYNYRGGDLPTPCSCDETGRDRCPAHSVKEGQSAQDRCPHGVPKFIGIKCAACEIETDK